MQDDQLYQTSWTWVWDHSMIWWPVAIVSTNIGSFQRSSDTIWLGTDTFRTDVHNANFSRLRSRRLVMRVGVSWLTSGTQSLYLGPGYLCCSTWSLEYLLLIKICRDFVYPRSIILKITIRRVCIAISSPLIHRLLTRAFAALLVLPACA